MDVEPGVWKEKTETGQTAFRIMLTVREEDSPHWHIFLHYQQFPQKQEALKWGRKVARLSNLRKILADGGDFWETVTHQTGHIMDGHEKAMIS